MGVYIVTDHKCKSKRNKRVELREGVFARHANGRPIRFKSALAAERYCAAKKLEIEKPTASE